MSKELSAKELKELKKQQKQAQRAARKEQGGGAPAAKTPGKPGSGHPQAVSHAPSSGPFLHLEQPKPVVSAPDVHPAILHLALQMQNCQVIGSTARCAAMMDAFAQVIDDFDVPADSTLSRSLTAYLSRQIEVLKSGRALSVSMGNAIRWLKQETSALLDKSGAEAKADLIEAIKIFSKERLDMAGRVIVESAASHIKSGDVILTFARSQVVLQTLAQAHADGKTFRVICADSQPLVEGKKLAAELVELGIPTTYVLITALPYVLNEVSTVMIGAHAMVANGHLFSRIGTSLVAMAASDRNIPVLVLCETIKFSERIQLDAFAVNEAMPAKYGNNQVFYDLTDQKYISKVVTELGALPASSVPVILREYKQLQ